MQFADFSQHNVKHQKQLGLCVLFGLVCIIAMNLYYHLLKLTFDEILH